MTLHFVYILQSVEDPDQYYTGITENIEQRIQEHNSGKSKHTAKFKPWSLVSYHFFTDQGVALQFEKYLKSGSGRAFAKKRLR